MEEFHDFYRQLAQDSDHHYRWLVEKGRQGEEPLAEQFLKPVTLEDIEEVFNKLSQAATTTQAATEATEATQAPQATQTATEATQAATEATQAPQTAQAATEATQAPQTAQAEVPKGKPF